MPMLTFKLSLKMLTFDFLVGKWRNDFMLDGIKAFELCEIDATGGYFVDGEHWFNVIEFEYDRKTSTISFTKSAVKEGDERQFFNVISKISDNFLENESPTSNKSTYSISYSRILN